jgi:hypothetical protein
MLQIERQSMRASFIERASFFRSEGWRTGSLISGKNVRIVAGHAKPQGVTKRKLTENLPKLYLGQSIPFKTDRSSVII